MQGKKHKLKSGQGFAGDDEGFGFEFTEEDIASIHVQHSASSLFLDRYSEDDMRQLLDHFGILRKLRARGHENITITFDLSDPFVQKMKWQCAIKANGTDDAGTVSENEEDDTLLCDCVFRILSSVSLLKAVRPGPQESKEAHEGAEMIRSWAALVEAEDPQGPLKLCVVEWLLLQDPMAPLKRGRLLPGQKQPGLGVFAEFGQLLGRFSEDCKFDAIINRPLYFHNAVMYSDPNTTFLNPHMEDCFRALCRDLVLQQAISSTAFDREGVFPGAAAALPDEIAAPTKSSNMSGVHAPVAANSEWMPLGDISHAVNCAALRLRAPKGSLTVCWSAQEQIGGVSPRAQAFLKGEAYKSACMRLNGISQPIHLLNVQALLHPPEPSTIQSMVVSRFCSEGNSGKENAAPLGSKDSSSHGLFFIGSADEILDVADIETTLSTAPNWHTVPSNGP